MSDCTNCINEKISFHDLCDAGTCVPDSLLMTPATCGTCGDDCEHKLKYLTLDGLRAQLGFNDFYVKASDTDQTPSTLFDKLGVDDCFTKTLDTTDPDDQRVVIGFNPECARTSLKDLTDGPGVYANCSIIPGTDTECDCPVSACPAGILVSNCNGDGWHWECPNQQCSTDPCYSISKSSQMFGFTGTDVGFMCPKKKYYARFDWKGDMPIRTYNPEIIRFDAPDLGNLTWTSNNESTVSKDTVDTDELDPSIVGASPAFEVVKAKIPCDGFYHIGIKGSCLTNRGIHTIRHQVMRKRSGIHAPLLDFRMEGTIFMKQDPGHDGYIGVDQITDLNSFFNNFPDVNVGAQTPSQRMEAGLGRSLRGHGFGQSDIVYLLKDDEIFFCTKVQTYSCTEEFGVFTGQMVYVSDSTSATNGLGAGITFFINEWDELSYSPASTAPTNRTSGSL